MPHIAQRFKTTLVNGRVYATKKNYATIILDYFRLCLEYDVPPFIAESLNVEAVMYWMEYRIWMRGHCNSAPNWSAALSWLCKCQGFPFKPPLHQKHPDFALYWENTKVAHAKAIDKKAPMLARHLWYFIKYHLRIDPTNLRAARYDDLIKALALSMIFLTMSRCTEILWSDKTEDPKIRIIHTGIKWAHISYRRRVGFRETHVLDIEVPWFKNQADRTVPKRIRTTSCRCDKPPQLCICAYFDLWPMIKEIRHRREHRVKRPDRIRTKGKGRLSQHQLDRLDIRPENYMFVNERGTILGYGFIYRLIQDVKKANKLCGKKPKIVPYSLRVGATSLAHHQCIDPLRVMRYVEWLPGTDPTMHSRYVQYTEVQLSTVPYEMLHGTLQFGEPTTNYIMKDPETFVLRNQVIKAALYSGDNAFAKRALMRTIVHDNEHQPPRTNLK